AAPKLLELKEKYPEVYSQVVSGYKAALEYLMATGDEKFFEMLVFAVDEMASHPEKKYAEYRKGILSQMTGPIEQKSKDGLAKQLSGFYYMQLDQHSNSVPQTSKEAVAPLSARLKGYSTNPPELTIDDL